MTARVSKRWWDPFEWISDEAKELTNVGTQPRAGVAADFGY